MTSKPETLEEVFDLFSVNLSTFGTGFFLRYVEILYDRLRRKPAKPCSGKVLRDLAAEYGMYYLALNSMMRASVRSMLEADDEALSFCGLEPQKRTVPALAEAMARALIAGKLTF